MNEIHGISVASVTVAYNGEHVLVPHLEALLRQTRPIDQIIVVNNGSRDNTAGILQSKFPTVTLIDLPTNTGVGGGFATGLEYAAFARKHDWVWLFDQDSLPKDDCLEALLQAQSHLTEPTAEVAVFAPVCINPQTNFQYFSEWWKSAGNDPLAFVDAVISSGSLMRNAALRTAGLPRADFFMDFVDFEHCARIRRSGYKIAMVRNGIMGHSLGNSQVINILGISILRYRHPPWREYYIMRNEIFTVWNLYPGWRRKISVMYRMVRHAAAVLVFDDQKVQRFKMLVLGFLDGRSMKLGFRFGPET